MLKKRVGRPPSRKTLNKRKKLEEKNEILNIIKEIEKISEVPTPTPNEISIDEIPEVIEEEKPINTKDKKSRKWVFTLNNYTEEEFTKIKEFGEKNCKYFIVGKEIGESGTPHLQGYMRFANARSFASMKKTIPKAHIEIAFGTDIENQKYCSKDNNFEERGSLSQQGERKDLNDIKNKILKGEMLASDILTEDPKFYHMYGRTLEKLEDVKNNKIIRTNKTKCIWIWGPTGTGKSQFATNKFLKYGPENTYIWKNDNGWWDSYNGQELVIMDDFRGEIKYNELLTLADNTPFAQVRRRNRPPANFTSKKIIITCSNPPEFVYKRQNEKRDSIDQLLRRIDIKHFSKSENEFSDKDDFNDSDEEKSS